MYLLSLVILIRRAPVSFYAIPLLAGRVEVTVDPPLHTHLVALSLWTLWTLVVFALPSSLVESHHIPECTYFLRLSRFSSTSLEIHSQAGTVLQSLHSMRRLRIFSTRLSMTVDLH